MAVNTGVPKMLSFLKKKAGSLLNSGPDVSPGRKKIMVYVDLFWSPIPTAFLYKTLFFFHLGLFCNSVHVQHYYDLNSIRYTLSIVFQVLLEVTIP
jgi:hypothetical protein